MPQSTIEIIAKDENSERQTGKKEKQYAKSITRDSFFISHLPIGYPSGLATPLLA